MPIAYDRAGSGEPLVLIHPLGADRQVWKPVIGLLTPHRDVISIDMPGFGGSTAVNHGAEPVPGALADEVGRFLDGLGLDDAHIAGNSLGGWIALELALDGRARTVTGIAPAGLWPRPYGPKPEIAHRFARATLPALRALMRSEGARRIALAGSVAHPERVPASDAAQLIRAYAEAPDFSNVNRAMRSNRFEHLADVTTPTTFAWCERDRLVAPPSSMPPHIRNLLLRDCGHIPMWDDPGAVAQAVLTGSGGVH